MKWTRRSFVATAATAALITAAACSPSTETTEEAATTDAVSGEADSEEVVNVYSSRHYDSDDQIYQQFHRKHRH